MPVLVRAFRGVAPGSRSPYVRQTRAQRDAPGPHTAHPPAMPDPMGATTPATSSIVALWGWSATVAPRLCPVAQRYGAMSVRAATLTVRPPAGRGPVCGGQASRLDSAVWAKNGLFCAHKRAQHNVYAVLNGMTHWSVRLISLPRQYTPPPAPRPRIILEMARVTLITRRICLIPRTTRAIPVSSAQTR